MGQKMAQKRAQKWPLFWPPFLDPTSDRGGQNDPAGHFLSLYCAFLDFFESKNSFFSKMNFSIQKFQKVPLIAVRIFKNEKTPKTQKVVQKNLAKRHSPKNTKIKNSKKSKKISKNDKIWQNLTKIRKNPIFSTNI